MFDSLRTADHDRVSRSLAMTACALAALAALWFAVRLVWLVLSPRADQMTATAPLSATGNVPPATTVAQWHLFGNSQSIDLARLATNAPATTLKLVLRGTLALPDAAQGVAIIADERGVENNYKVGETVTGGAKLAEVYPDHVVLQHDGTAESLALPKPEEHAPSLPAQNQQRLASGPNASSVPPGFNGRSAAPGASVPKALPGIAGAEDLARQVHIEPVFDAGKLSGARLSGSGAVATLMGQAGLKPTDVVTSVNGTPLSNVTNPQQLMDSLRNAPSIQVTVQRDGKPATLTLPLR
ncbi:MAG TPA: type II secretion system protein N [Rudaea sp.]